MKLNIKSKATTIRALALPVLRYSFGFINWRLGEVEDRQENKSV